MILDSFDFSDQSDTEINTLTQRLEMLSACGCEIIVENSVVCQVMNGCFTAMSRANPQLLFEGRGVTYLPDITRLRPYGLMPQAEADVAAPATLS